MNAPFVKPWTQEQFFAWAGHQEGRYEFDGFRPVAMNGGTITTPSSSAACMMP